MFSFARFRFVLLGDLSDTHTHQTAPHWTWSGVLATGHGVALRSLHPERPVPRPSLWVWPKQLSGSCTPSERPFHTPATQRSVTLAPATVLERKRGKRETDFSKKNLAFSLPFPSQAAPGGASGDASGTHLPGGVPPGHPGSVPGMRPGSQHSGVVALFFSITCTHELGLA